LSVSADVFSSLDRTRRNRIAYAGVLEIGVGHSSHILEQTRSELDVDPLGRVREKIVFRSDAEKVFSNSAMPDRPIASHSSVPDAAMNRPCR